LLVSSRIKAVGAYPLAYPEPHYKGIERYVTLARVETEDGVVGWGECISQFPESSIATKIVIERGLGPLLVGEDGLDVERLWHVMLDRMWWYGPEGIGAFAISALDMALWDVKGKALGLPVCQLAGGMLQPRVAAMGSIVFDMDDFEWTLGEFEWMRDAGYRIVKGGWGMRPDVVFGQQRSRDLELVRRIRETIGSELELVVDTPGGWGVWDTSTAIQRFHDLEPYSLKWIEQPLLPRDLAGHARLRRAVSTAIGTGEDEWSPETYARLIEAEAVDVVQMDPGRCLGITGCLEVIKLVEAANLAYSMHTWSSALNTAASVHLLAVSKHGSCLDLKPHESPLQHELVSDPWLQRDGFLDVRAQGGLGVDVLDEIVARYAFD
jgi:L-alanine-DL-glutamate epimerase-like enolase superfamily enzyme